MILLVGWVAGIATGIIGREIAGWLAFFGRSLIRRSVRGLPEPTQTQLRDKWLDVAAKLPRRRSDQAPLGFRLQLDRSAFR
jgi:hypothetical protein